MKLKYYQYTNRFRRWWRFVLDLPTLIIVKWLHGGYPPARSVPNQPAIIINEGVTLMGYTFIIDNRGNHNNAIIKIAGSHNTLDTCHFRSIDVPRFMIAVEDKERYSHAHLN